MVHSQKFFVAVLSLSLISPVFAQKDTKDASADQQQDPLKRERTPEQQKKQSKALKQELSKEYKNWLENDVRWIISDEEMTAFKQLSNDEERDQFIEQFWLRRDPSPDTVENEFKEEHYRRIAYANERFAAGKPGSKTDRGRIYIVYGPPDSIDSHPSGGTYNRPDEEGGGTTSTFPFETWRYRYIEGISQEVEIEFVDTCMCGDYHMTMDRSEKDALLNVPGAGLTTAEEMGLSDKSQRFTGGSLERLGQGVTGRGMNNDQFSRMEQFYKLNRPPAVKFKDLEEVVNHKIRYNVLPFDVRMDFVKITNDTVLVPVTLQLKNREVTFVNKDGVQRGTVNIFGRVSTITGRVAQTFEDTVQVDVPAELLEKTKDNSSIYWKAMPLRVGRYKLEIVVKDVNGDKLGTWTRGIMVPDMSEDRGLTSSTLIVADQMEKVPSKSIGAGNFVIGTTKVRPRVDAADGKPAQFKRSQNQKVNFWMQAYNLQVDQKTNKADAAIEYDIVDTTTKKSVMQLKESSQQMGNIGDLVTLEKTLPLANVPPGQYQITIKITDNISKQTISPTAKFAVVD